MFSLRCVAEQGSGPRHLSYSLCFSLCLYFLLVDFSPFIFYMRKREKERRYNEKAGGDGERKKNEKEKQDKQGKQEF